MFQPLRRIFSTTLLPLSAAVTRRANSAVEENFATSVFSFSHDGRSTWCITAREEASARRCLETRFDRIFGVRWCGDGNGGACSLAVLTTNLALVPLCSNSILQSPSDVKALQTAHRKAALVRDTCCVKFTSARSFAVFVCVSPCQGEWKKKPRRNVVRQCVSELCCLRPQKAPKNAARRPVHDTRT